MSRLLRLPERVFYGWWVVSGSVLIQALQSMLFTQSFGVYVPFWMEEFGWSRTTVSLAHSLHRTESGLLGPVHGWLLQRFTPQKVVMGGMALVGLGFLVLGLAHGSAPFFLAFMVIAVGASLCGIMSHMTLAVNWFERRRARAMAIVGLGISIGGLLVPLVALALEHYGWRTVAAGSGVVFLALAWPLGRLLVSDPESMGLRPDGLPPLRGEAGEPAPQPEERPVKPAEVLKRREFWLLSLGHGNALAIVEAVAVHFVVYVRDTLSLGVTTAATMLTVITVCQMAGQAAGGVLGDRFDKRFLAASGMAMHSTAMLLLVGARSAPPVLVAAALHGLAWGLRGPLMSAMRADYFGRKAFSMVMGYSSLVLMVGSVLGPLATGMITDATGAYGLAFGSLAVVGALGLAAFLALPRARRA